MNDRPLTALVTGGNRGIGHEVSRALGGLGYRVVIGSRDPRLGDESAAQLAREGILVRALPLDVTDPASIARAVVTESF